MRLISVSSRPMPTGPCGGSGGVSYRLMKANDKYSLFEETVFVFIDKCISSSKGEITLSSGPVSHQLAELEVMYRKLGEDLEYKEDDYFVFHDLESFCAMKQCIPWVINTVVVYHQQGSIYSESLFMGNEPNDVYEQFCFDLTRFAVEESGLFAFPSHGARQALIDTLPEIRPYLNKKREVILYNGCSPTVDHEDSPLDGLFGMLDQVNGDIFVTVAALNEAKGVERLPSFFKDYANYVDDYFWIVIGRGSKGEELEKGLTELEGHVLWLNIPIPNQDIIKLYDIADYYILSHRYSIFDYSTIEAMHMGCVPILTPVGGNLEMIIEENGYFLDDSLSGKDFLLWRNEHNIDELKDRNRRIAREKFSEYSMLKSYHDLISDM